jgi:hypothetical protein
MLKLKCCLSINISIVVLKVACYVCRLHHEGYAPGIAHNVRQLGEVGGLEINLLKDLTGVDDSRQFCQTAVR